jgi:SAM-dependent methyltransferase
VHGELQERYDQWHEEHARPSSPKEERFHAWLLDLLGTPDGRLLDVACGAGRFLSRAGERGFDVAGVDISQVAIDAARTSLPGADLRVAAAEELPFEDKVFAALTCIGSLEHVPDPDAAVAEMARVLADRGRAVIFVPNLFFLGHVYFGIRHGTQPSEGGQGFSERFMSSQGWTTLLEQNGMRVQQRHTWNEIWATEKVGALTVRLWNAASRFVPRNAAYGFAFVCAPNR